MDRASLFRALVVAVSVIVVLAVCSVPSQAASIVVQYSDGASEGFNDPVLGAQRQAAFEYAADIWASTLTADEIVVDAQMNALGGTVSSATLGYAGAAFVARDFTGRPLAGTWYPIALASQLAGTDLMPGEADINAVFNGDVDGDTVLGSTHWYYGTDGNPGSDIDFVAVLLHELGHGLGFFDMIDDTTGGWYDGYPDVYGLNLTRPGVGQFSDMSNAERLDALESANVFWNGTNVVTTHGSAAKIFAPSSYQTGSSISHWDTSLGGELMEPYYAGPNHDAGLAIDALRDLGWTVQGGTTTTLTSTTTSTTTTTLPLMDPFLCYKVKRTKNAPKFRRVRGVDLSDQFEDTSPDVIKPKVICNPASLDEATLLDADTHLVGYSIEGTSEHNRHKEILVTTAFGPAFVNTIMPDRLLVPSAKSLDVEPAALDPAMHDVDHFNCYAVRRTPGSQTPHKGLQVTIVDQFTTEKNFVVRKAKRLCTPVDKNGAGIKDQEKHVLCYSLRPKKRQPKHARRVGVYVANEIGSSRLDTKKEELLCMPALKEL